MKASIFFVFILLSSCHTTTKKELENSSIDTFKTVSEVFSFYKDSTIVLDSEKYIQRLADVAKYPQKIDLPPFISKLYKEPDILERTYKGMDSNLKGLRRRIFKDTFLNIIPDS